MYFQLNSEGHVYTMKQEGLSVKGQLPAFQQVQRGPKLTSLNRSKDLDWHGRGTQVNKFELVGWDWNQGVGSKSADRQTDKSENITFSHSIAGGKNPRLEMSIFLLSRMKF